MKKMTAVICLSALLASCGGNATEEEQTKQDIQKMDSASTVLDESRKTIEQKSADVENSLKALESEMAPSK